MTAISMFDVLTSLEGEVSTGRAIATLLVHARDDIDEDGEEGKRAFTEMWFLIDQLGAYVDRLDGLVKASYKAGASSELGQEIQQAPRKPAAATRPVGPAETLRAADALASEAKAAGLLKRAYAARLDYYAAGAEEPLPGEDEGPKQKEARAREDAAWAELAAIKSTAPAVLLAQVDYASDGPFDGPRCGMFNGEDPFAGSTEKLRNDVMRGLRERLMMCCAGSPVLDVMEWFRAASAGEEPGAAPAIAAE